MKHYPLEPLAAALNIELHHTGGQQPDQPPEGLTAMAELLGVSTRRLRYAARDGLTWRLADRWAVRAGKHPQWIWPDWYDDAPGEDDAWYDDDPSLDDLAKECLRLSDLGLAS